jgi:hypothetical protein
VKEKKLAAFYAAYRADGHGRAAYDSRMLGGFNWLSQRLTLRSCDA